MSYARSLAKAMKPHLQPDRITLEQINQTLGDRYLHATKGFRTISIKRTLAAQLTAEIKAGMHGSRRIPRTFIPPKDYRHCTDAQIIGVDTHSDPVNPTQGE